MGRKDRDSNRSIDLSNCEQLVKALLELECLKPARVDELRFHIEELLESFELFSLQLPSVTKGVKQAKRNATKLWESSSELIGELEHIQYHLRGALVPLKQLQSAARELPPIGLMTDNEISEQALDEARKKIFPSEDGP